MHAYYIRKEVTIPPFLFQGRRMTWQHAPLNFFVRAHALRLLSKKEICDLRTFVLSYKWQTEILRLPFFLLGAR